MKIAEVIAAVRTAPYAVTTLRELVERAGHKAVVVADQPGFLVNHAGRGLYTEGLRIVEECVASPADVDDVLREGLGFRMGPFELLDLTGLDVSSKVMTSIYAQFQEEPRFRPSSLVPPRVAAGLYGRKSGEGWYRYENGQKIAPLRSAPPPLRVGLSLWIDPSARGLADLATLARRADARRVDDPARADVCLVQPIGEDATSAALRARRRRVALPRGRSDHALRATAHADADRRDGAGGARRRACAARERRRPRHVIGDSIGFIAQRVIATIVNIAANIAQRGIAAVDDLEAAVRLGLGYPLGPLTWGDRVGGPSFSKSCAAS